MRKPNYQFEKRRRDLEKKAKNEEKRLRKLEKAANPSSDANADPVSVDIPETDGGSDTAVAAPEPDSTGSAPDLA